MLLTREQLRQKRLEFLSSQPIGELIPLESLIKAGFPPSSMYPAFWSSTNLGACLAFELGCRVVFNYKLLSITLVPMDEEERTMHIVRRENKRRANQNKTKARLQMILSLQQSAFPQEDMDRSADEEQNEL